MMSDILIFIGVMLAILSGLFIVVMTKVGFSYTALKDYIMKTENKSIKKASAGIIGAMLIVALAVFSFGNVVKAEGVWFNTGSVFIGVEQTSGASPFCTSEGVNDKLTSNLGADIQVYKNGNHSISGVYTHHSCALNPDINVYDAIGFRYVLRIF